MSIREEGKLRISESSRESLEERQITLTAKEREILHLLVEGWWSDESEEGEKMKYGLLRKLSLREGE